MINPNKDPLEDIDNLKKLQKTELEILLAFDTLCRQNGIPYQLFGGTLLGAIRHKGFIPWDDDIDVCMDRKSYNIFLDTCLTKLDRNQYFLQTYNTDRNFFHSFARIRKNNTIAIQKQYAGIDMHHGIFIDVFPLDKIPDTRITRKAQYLMLRITRRQKNYKLMKVTGEEGNYLKVIIKRLIISFYKLLPMSFFNSIETRIATMYQHKKTKDSTLLVEAVKRNYHRCMRQNYTLSNLIEISFEGYSFLAPEDTHGTLSKIYGDYMSFPPIEDRKGHHNIVKLSI